MSGFSLARKAVDAFNRHGSLTARLVENELAVEIRHADSGEHLTTLWAPAQDERWTWQHTPNSEAYRWLDSGSTIEQVVRVVALSLLDERPKR